MKKALALVMAVLMVMGLMAGCGSAPAASTQASAQAGTDASAALAGAAGALYGLNFSNLVATKFDFNTSILVLVFVVLGSLGNIWGSILAATVLTILPEALRGFDDYRMLIYAVVLILVMLATNNPQLKALFTKLIPHSRKGEEANA